MKRCLRCPAHLPCQSREKQERQLCTGSPPGNVSVDYDDLNYGDHVEDHDDPDGHGDHVDAYRDDIFLGDDGPQIVEVESGRPSPKTTSVNPQQNLVIKIVELSDVFFLQSI